MLCEECKKRQASVHLTKIINGQKTEMHLCEQCAREKETFNLNFLSEPMFSIHNLLAGLLDYDLGAEASHSSHRPLIVRCNRCGWTYEDFTRLGRLGCGACYEQFADKLEPLLRRIHGTSLHTGKVPLRAGSSIKLKKTINNLRQRLQEAVSREEFETAARLRDEIRELEKKIQAE